MKLGNHNWTQSLGWVIALTGTFSGGGSAFALQSLSLNNLSPTVYAGDPNGSPTDNPAARITNNPLFDGVGSIATNTGGGCTGAAISLTHVLSAAHCFSASAAPNVSFRLNNTNYAGVVSIFPGAVFPFDDVAVITLGQSLPSTTPTYPLFRNPIPLGTTISFVGFGAFGDGVNGNTGSFDFNVKRLGSNVVDYFYIQSGENATLTNDPARRNALVGFDFDGTDSSTNFFGGLTIGNNLESTYGPGDSGSANFINENGTLKIVGVSTGVFDFINPRPFFGSGGIFTDVSGFSTFIDGVVATPVPFEFSPAIGLGLLGVWGVVGKLRKNSKKS